ncbi:MAG: transcription-repair coupling factor [Fimbriimonadaceae bacterium]|nr:MAG: transcription-repair coupling factor [Fimbriimonadaceae bacterium]
MRLQEFPDWLLAQEGFRDSVAALGPGSRCFGLAAEARPLWAAALYRHSPCKLLVVASSYERALHWQARLTLCGVPGDQVRLLPSGQSALFEDAAPETVALSDRIGAVKSLTEPEPGIVVATAASALERTLPAELLESAFLSVRVGDQADPLEVVRRLQVLGYELAEPVRVPGQVSRRGGILDVFPMGRGLPVRLEWFDDLVESAREFDPMTQRSVGPASGLFVSPSRETLYSGPPGEIADLVEGSLEAEADRLGSEAGARLRELVSGDVTALRQGVFFDRLDLYRPLLHPESGSAVDLLPDDGWLVLDEPLELEAVANRAEEELAQALEHRAARGEILHSTALDFMLPAAHLGRGARTLALSAMDAVPDWTPPGAAHQLGVKSLEPYRGQAAALGQALTNWIREGGLKVAVSTDQPNRAKAMLQQIELFPLDAPPEDGSGLWIVDGNLAGGFVCPEQGWGVVTDHELFGVGRLKLPQRKFSEGVPVSTVLDLKPGDFVVHINFGIGVYQGLVRRTDQTGIEKEYLVIDYKAPDRLFVPADQLDRIQKYLAPEDAPPKIHRLTGGEWQKAVGKAREEAREFARDLIRLYAERRKVTRPGFGPDSPWQAEMEHTFPWVETPSQHTAIVEVKQDLQTDYPMDRLVCGDVGFGKTEVAVRAAFKVAQAGRQVAVLCPTTILSEQHYRNFAERMAGFPTRVALLNRFTGPGERRAVKEGLASGEVDIVIGTHALLNESLEFRDLGLLVIDEEQKFGVKHKEALKKIRASVDVLTLSATPIPRTLSMALMDIRPMSLINDPPPGRLPIRTFVRPFGKEVVREALLRELARGGQVFYVSNRVEGIYHIAERVRQLVPTARVAVGHGQMGEKELEPVMLGFIKGEIDVLVSTTIVESGLDIPNANTLIVENADRFGLAQLYQLRGRVGRSDRQAYAYFLYSSSKELTEGAWSRLKALQEFSSLGSGYSLAFRDLQIRGAGDLLGAKQSGQMTAVGFDLYSQLIDSEVKFLKTYADGERPEAYDDPLAGLEPLPSLDLPVKALIPADFIEDEGQRLYYYKQLMAVREVSALGPLAQEIEDRYGTVPREVKSAFDVMACRLGCVELQIEKVDGNGGRLAVTFRQTAEHSPRVFSILQRARREAYLSQDVLVWPFTGDPVAAVREMLDALRSAIVAVEEQRAMLRS